LRLIQRGKRFKQMKRIYQINFDGTNWNTCERQFRTDAEAIAYVRHLEGREGTVIRTSKNRLEVHFDM